MVEKEQFSDGILHLQPMGGTNMFSEKDLNDIKNKGKSPEDVISQLQRFSEGFPSLQISAPAEIGNGILKLSDEEVDMFIDKYEESNVDVLKFVPSSGAASRMFKNLYAFLEKFDGKKETADTLIREDKKAGKFFTEIDAFAFHNMLDEILLQKHDISIAEAIKSYKHDLVIKALLLESGMNYGNLPKGLLSFHLYNDHVRTAAQEHLAEGLDYAEKNGKVHVHFTVSPSHREQFENHITHAINRRNSYVKVSASFSEQFPSTDTIAATTDFKPFREKNENLLFRPGGHGALLHNLNQLTSDLIFIKNIDNVVPDRLRSEGVKYKKAIAGILLSYQQRIFKLMKLSDKGKSILNEGKELLGELGLVGDLTEEEVKNLLDRPIRVCGMVKNEGEPGGGPFWVKGMSFETLQIVESAQVDKSDKNQHAIFKSGTHFNPVDIVCGIKNYKGEKYNLLEYRDEEAGFISEKSYSGRKLLAMELPGLWNGGMSNWNTIFVEVPLITFNPVKTVTDLLKPAHR